MRNWLGKLLGGKGSSEDKQAQTNSAAPQTQAPRDETQQAFARALEALFTRTREKDSEGAGLASDVVSFVLRGEPVAVLAAVNGQAIKFQGLPIHGYNVNDVEGRMRHEAFYALFEQMPAPVRWRWAQFLDSVFSGAGFHQGHGLSLPAGAQAVDRLLHHAMFMQQEVRRGGRERTHFISCDGLGDVFEIAGVPAGALIVAAWTPGANPNYLYPVHSLLVSLLEGYDQAVLRHIDLIRAAIAGGDVDARLHHILLMSKLPAASLAPFASELAEMATGGSKQLRAAVGPLVETARECLRPVFEQLATKGKPEQRLNALRLLAEQARKHGDDDMARFVRETAQADKAQSVQGLLSEWDAKAAATSASVERYDFPMPVVSWDGTLTPETIAALDALWKNIQREIENTNRKLHEFHERMVAEGNKHYTQKTPHQWPLLGEPQLAELKAAIASNEPSAPQIAAMADNRHYGHGLIGDALKRYAATDGVTLAAVLKTLTWFRTLLHPHGFNTLIDQGVIDAMHAARGQPSLLELSMYLDAMGYGGGQIVTRSYCLTWGQGLARRWSNEAVWPFFATHVELLTTLLHPTAIEDVRWLERPKIYRAIASLPFPPPALVFALFDVALGTTRNERPLAQEALANHPGKEARIIQALADGKAEVRTVAAQWLQRLRHEPAIPALETAVAKEKHDVPKGAMLDALQALGQPVEKYLNRDLLAKEAAKSIAKGLPKDLDWFAWDALPSVRWGDNGKPVDSQVLQWLLVQAVKQKSPEPNAVLRKYCAMFGPRDREALGQHVLESWIAQDIRPVPAEQAMRNARGNANQQFNFMKAHPKYNLDNPLKDMSEDQLYAHFLPGCLRQPAGSATDSKGLLAVAAACAAERAAAPVARYLKEYYGTRASQGKSLIAMLAWIEHPGATQLMLSVGHRFRTKSFQEEATRQAEALADRKGWTMAELADRTIPTAGFDEDSVLDLSYGSRSFTAKLLPDFKVELFNPDGKKIAALSEPRADDDAEAAKQSKKALASAKKEIKSIVDLQTDRLYEALCTERDWGADEWSRYLLRHPIVRHLAQRLVWIATHEARVVASFRPLDDGTLSDNDDNVVELAPEWRVRVAHDTNLPREQVEGWQQHLRDYEIAGLFQQFGKGSWELPEGQAAAQQMKDFEGHLIETFALRGRATKLGYSRGPTEDGGWFFSYHKRFPTLGLQAEIGFTGNGLPETNRTVALLHLCFQTTQGERNERTTLALSDVPKVLLSECYNDLRLIAADGSGYDAQWEKKSQ